MITGGSAAPGGPVLSYAPQAEVPARPVAAAPSPLPVSRPPDLISAHLDRSNFRNLTRPSDTNRSAGRSMLGAALPPLRAAARVDGAVLAPVPTARPASFGTLAPGLAPGRFSLVGPAPAPRTDVD